MDIKQYNLASRITALIVFLVASFTYLATIEPTTSFWDCGEFIASSYKLEVGHPPGNPVFQLIARFFTLFTSAEYAAAAVNAMSALCSALTIFFLFLTIAHLGRRIALKGNETPSAGQAVAILGSSLVGSLAYCWSDTFWFSAVEGEVYAMSSLFTAVVFWAMLKWEEEADMPYANRWIVLISLLMGLSIGVHLLNLLCIPAIAFIYYYKKGHKFTFWRGFGVLALSGVILATILWGIIPYTPKIAAYFDLLFVNSFGAPFNTGAIVFMILLLAACAAGIWFTYKKEKVLANTILWCYTMIIVGYSAFAVVVIRSSANTPTNEYQPDNPFTLVRYLGREQYGSNPLIYGESYASRPVDMEKKPYYTPLGDKYIKTQGALNYVFTSDQKMLFPRMWSLSPDHASVYNLYSDGGGNRMPTMKENLAYFFDFQCNWMYMRYFMWNFAGRQNDFWSPTPGDPVKGNWECGIPFIDKARLGDQSDGPDYIVNHPSKNHYYLLPLILGLLGMFYQLNRDKRNWWVTMLLFILTGIAIVVYLNQPPLQVRERDYAYAGSFYVFTIWIGLAVMAVYDLVRKYTARTRIPEWGTAAGVTLVLLFVPIIMVSENWDDHDRSGRYTARDVAYNYLASVGENGILVTFGDNDTFPLWYIQEVEGIRTDVRIMNTSLLGTDWYIDQMQNKVYESDPVKFSITRDQYLYGLNESPSVIDRIGHPITLKQMIELFRDPRVKVQEFDGEFVDYVPAKQLLLPVNKENAMKYGIVAPQDYDKMEDTLVLNLSQTRITKAELMILDMLSNYEWDRPISFISAGGDLTIGIKDYLQFDGFTYKLVPIRSNTRTSEAEQVNSEELFNRIKNTFVWDSFNADNIHIDYQNLYTFVGSISLRGIFVNTARALLKEGKPEKAVEMLDMMQEVVREDYYPLNSFILGSYNEFYILDAIDFYFKAGESEKASELARRFADETLKSIKLCAKPHGRSMISRSGLEANYAYYTYIVETLNQNGAKEEAKELQEGLIKLLESLQ